MILSLTEFAFLFVKVNGDFFIVKIIYYYYCYGISISYNMVILINYCYYYTI